MKTSNKIVAAALSLSAALVTGQAMAAGTVTGVTTDKSTILLGQSLNANVLGTIVKDVFKKGCQVRVSLKYADNTVEVPHPGFLVDAFPANGFYLKPTKVGKVKVVADGGGTNSLGYPACQGSALAEITVNGLVVVNPHLEVKVKPTQADHAEGGIIIQGAPQPSTAPSQP